MGSSPDEEDTLGKRQELPVFRPSLVNIPAQGYFKGSPLSIPGGARGNAKVTEDPRDPLPSGTGRCTLSELGLLGQ